MAVKVGAEMLKRPVYTGNFYLTIFISQCLFVRANGRILEVAIFLLQTLLVKYKDLLVCITGHIHVANSHKNCSTVNWP